MQDPDIPPEVVEGEIDGVADVVRPIVAAIPATIVNSIAASTPLPWITTIARDREATPASARDAAAQDLRPLIHPSNPLPCRSARTPIRASSRSSLTCSFLPRFRKPRASST